MVVRSCTFLQPQCQPAQRFFNGLKVFLARMVLRTRDLDLNPPEGNAPSRAHGAGRGRDPALADGSLVAYRRWNSRARAVDRAEARPPLPRGFPDIADPRQAL